MNTDPYTRWLQVLAGLLNPALPGELREPLGLLLPHLRAEFSAHWLTPESARLVAQAKRFGSAPDWGVVSGALRDYVRANRPINGNQIAAPREPDYEGPSEQSLKAVGEIMAGFAAWRADNPPLSLNSTGAKLSDVSLRGGDLERMREKR